MTKMTILSNNKNKYATFRLTNPVDGYYLAECYGHGVEFSNSYKDILRFLVHASPVEKTAPRIVWSITEFYKTICSMLPEQYRVDLEGKGSRHVHRAEWQDGDTRYRLFYQPEKFLGIHAGGFGFETTFYELDQFFPDDVTINSVDDIEKAASELVDTFRALGVSSIDNMRSPVAVFEDSAIVQSAYKALPDPLSIPSGCQEYAIDADPQSAWCSNYQIGAWKEGETHQFDMSSCYGSIASKLVSLDGAEYKFSKKRLTDYKAGFLRGVLSIYPDHPLSPLSPIVAPLDGDTIGNPVGNIKGTFYLPQIDFIESHGMGEFKMRDGWYIKLNSPILPLAGAINTLYQLRQYSDLASMCLKRVITGIIGRLGEFHGDEPTDKTNVVYHTMIRNTAPLLIGDFLIKNGIRPEELVHVNTDGFRATRDLPLPKKAPLGMWRREKDEPVVVLSPKDVYEGTSADDLLDKFNQDKRSGSYEGVNLLSLSAEQNRYYGKLPKSGTDVLTKKYQSEPIELE